jgi:hypothetical protein
VHDEFSKNRSWAYFEKQKGPKLFAFQPVRNQLQDIGPHYLSKPVAGFAQVIYVQLQFFDHLAHNFIAKGLKSPRERRKSKSEISQGRVMRDYSVLIMPGAFAGAKLQTQTSCFIVVAQLVYSSAPTI